MHKIWYFILLLIFQVVKADEILIDVQILSKYHPAIVDIETSHRIFHLDQSRPDSVEFTAPVEEQIVVKVNNNISRIYRGKVQAQWAGDEYIIHNTTPLEVYVAGVVIGELGAGIHPELARAQAILARTYALKARQRGSLSDLAYHQVFKGFDAHAQKIFAYTKETGGLVLRYQGKLADVLYHAECGSNIYGTGEFWNSSSYQSAVALPVGMKKGAMWATQLSDRQIKEVFPHYTGIKIVDSIPIMIDLGNRQIDIESFRLAINRKFGWNTIPSNEFNLKSEHSGWQFIGRGRGHLVGMCQLQANELAQHGWHYQQILKLFYPQYSIMPYR